MSEENKGIGDVTEQMERLIINSLSSEILPQTVEPAGYYYLVGPDGKAELKQATPSRHRETLNSPKELGEFALEAIGQGDRIEAPTLYVNENGAVFVYSSAERLDAASCTLLVSPQYRWLLDHSKGMQYMTQPELIQLLRITMRGCVVNPNLLGIVRKVKFSTSSDGESNIQHGNASMGKSIAASVMGTDVIPEEFALDVPVWENFPMKQRIMCAIDIDLDNRTFGVMPYPVECKAALDRNISEVQKQLAEQVKIPVFQGKPQ
jgi:hypothetical protein